MTGTAIMTPRPAPQVPHAAQVAAGGGGTGFEDAPC